MDFLDITWQHEVRASTVTSMQCGGTIQFLTQPTTREELLASMSRAEELGLPIKILGGGSNLIFADAGFQGLVIQPKYKQLERRTSLLDRQPSAPSAERYRASSSQYLQLEPDQSPVEGQPVQVEVGAAVPWGQLVAWSLRQRLHGLHWYARIPCQVGGAVYNNIHAASHLLQEVVVAVEAYSLREKQVVWYNETELEFSYDQSRFHSQPAVILGAVFQLLEVGESQNQIDTVRYRDWTSQKAKVQPSGANSGSVFKNLSEAQAMQIGQSQLAAGWYIEQSGLKGRQIGGMQVFPGHANFICNLGDGRQDELVSLVDEIRSSVQQRFGIWLEPEIELIDTVGNSHLW